LYLRKRTLNYLKNLKNYKFLIVLLLILCPIISNAQDYYKFRAKYVTHKEFVDYKWTDWSDWIETNFLITVDLNDERITIYQNTADDLHFDIINYDYSTDKNYKVIEFTVIDNYNERCTVNFYYDEFDEDRLLIVYYSELYVAYSLKALSI
jgi:hypothetical protein